MKTVLASFFVLMATSVVFGQTQQQALDAANAANVSYQTGFAAMTTADTAAQGALMKSSEAYMKYNTWKMTHGRDMNIEAALASAAAYMTGSMIPPYNQGKSTYTSAITQYQAGSMYYMMGNYTFALECYTGANASFQAMTGQFNDASGRACETVAMWQEAIDMCVP